MFRSKIIQKDARSISRTCAVMRHRTETKLVYFDWKVYSVKGTRPILWWKNKIAEKESRNKGFLD